MIVTKYSLFNISSASELGKAGRFDKEIKRRVAIGKATMIALEKLWRDKHVGLNTKRSL